MLYKMPQNENITFEQWQKQLREQERREIGNAKKVNYDHPAYSAFFAIDIVVFDRMFQFIPLYWMPQKAKEEKPGVIGMYKDNRIMIDKDFYEAHGMDEDFINLMYHEMIHGYCDWKQIEDTKGEKHLYAFAEACLKNGGTCFFIDGKEGFADASLLPDVMKKVQYRIKKYGKGK